MSAMRTLRRPVDVNAADAARLQVFPFVVDQVATFLDELCEVTLVHM